jgi:uncharacterized membrane protein HdeD (DUF308 family)
MITDEIKAQYHRTKWALVLRGVFSLAVGILILTRPLASVAAFALVIALWAFSDGIVRIVYAFDLRAVAPHWWALLLTGVVSVLFGAAAIYYYPGLSLGFVVALTAFWLIAGGVLGGYIAIQERSAGISWGWTMALAVLAVVGGALAFMYPGITLAWLLGLIAAFALIGGVVTLMGAWRLQSFEHTLSGAMHGQTRAHT